MVKVLSAVLYNEPQAIEDVELTRNLKMSQRLSWGSPKLSINCILVNHRLRR